MLGQEPETMRIYASSDDLRAVVRGMINPDCTQRDIARQFAVSSAYLSDFLAGKREAGPAILNALGYDKTPFYKRAK
jgi:hypothetical protein